jgi:hypothetical protein
VYRFNNCRKRNHAYLYGANAFFDLETTGQQSEVANRLAKKLLAGETCVVATPAITHDTTCDVTFDWYRFSKRAVKPDPERNVPCYAYFGELLKTETLSRAIARRAPLYKDFFNKLGHFKRPSVQRVK